MLAGGGRKSRDLAVVGVGTLGVFWIGEQGRDGNRGGESSLLGLGRLRCRHLGGPTQDTRGKLPYQHHNPSQQHQEAESGAQADACDNGRFFCNSRVYSRLLSTSRSL